MRSDEDGENKFKEILSRAVNCAVAQPTVSSNGAAFLWVHSVNGVFRKELRCDGARPVCILGETERLLAALLKARDSDNKNPEA